MDFRGFANVIFPKGNGGVGQTQAVEVLARPQIQLDVGKLVFGKSHLPDMYFAVEYWLNKFGNDHTKLPGSYADLSDDWFRSPLLISWSRRSGGPPSTNSTAWWKAADDRHAD